MSSGVQCRDGCAAAAAQRRRHSHADWYEIRWLVASETAASLSASFADLARALGIQIDGQSDEDIRERVKRELQQRPAWLLVFDNALDERSIAKYRVSMPAEGQSGVVRHTIVTSRNDTWPRRVALSQLTADEALALLAKEREIASDLEEPEALRLVETLGVSAAGHPPSRRLYAEQRPDTS